MSNLDKEIEVALARVERLKEKKRVAEAKERTRFTDAIMSILDEIENAEQVNVRTLIDRAQARIDEQSAKRKRAAVKAAARRREASSEASNESSSRPRWGDER